MLNKLVQTVLSRRFSNLRLTRTCKSTIQSKILDNYNYRFVITSKFSFLTQINCKYKNSRKISKSKNDYQESDNEGEDVDNFEELEETGKKIVTLNVKAMRLDVIVKSCFGISRNKSETAFYDSKIRRNGKKVLKKSELVYKGDEIDLIHSTSPNNPDMLVISRILILNISANNDLYRIKIARDKNLTIDSKTNDEE